uniref:CASP-like protein n=1 Tax=Salix viminalis TaxID=40686 RepID=A0A6N2KH29_SALVM
MATNAGQSSSQRALAMALAVASAVVLSPLTTSSSMSVHGGDAASFIPSPDPSWVLRIGSSSWGLAGVLVMLVLVLSWQDSVQEFFWR